MTDQDELQRNIEIARDYADGDFQRCLRELPCMYESQLMRVYLDRLARLAAEEAAKHLTAPSPTETA